MSAFVLIHGAFRGGWCWREVARRLRAHGHDVYAPSLTGAGERRHLVAAVRGLETYVEDIVQLLEAEDLREVVLVGHSHGGVVITAASQRAAARIRQLVYLDAPVPRHGEAAADMMPAEARAAYPRPAPGTLLPPRPVEGLPSALADWVNARLCPHPVDPSFDPIELTEPAALALPRTYVFCRGTPAHYPSSFARARLEGEGVAIRELPCGHDAPLIAPAAVVELLLEIARDNTAAEATS